MTFWELFVALARAASIVRLSGPISRIHSSRATRRLVQQLHMEIHRTLAHMDARWQNACERMDQRGD